MTAPASLAERRAALKRLLASGESAIGAYERVLEGASEKDRRSLFKSVPFARLVPPAVEWEWDAVPENTVHMCAFLRAAHSRGARAHNTAQYVKSPQRIRSRRGASISVRTRRAECLRRLAREVSRGIRQRVKRTQRLGHRA